MATTYEPIATNTLGSAAANITFSSIPATYTDLRVVVVALTTNNNWNIELRLNSDSSTLYSQIKKPHFLRLHFSTIQLITQSIC